MPVALITGGSAGLGRALATALAQQGWELILVARTQAPLEKVAAQLRERTAVTTVDGDVADPAVQLRLADEIARAGRLDLLVNNASTLGPTPLRALVELTTADLRAIAEVNLVAPLRITQLALPAIRHSGGTIINISSDAATSPYPGWGGYGASKAALDQLTAVLGAEHPDLHIYAIDPGDMRTAMHQAAFPGEDISDRPLPETVVPAFLALLDRRPPSGRYRAADLAADLAADSSADRSSDRSSDLLADSSANLPAGSSADPLAGPKAGQRVPS